MLASEAIEFFSQLETFSDRYLTRWGQPGWNCGWRNDWPCEPNGVIIHYTASSSLRGTVRWFCNPQYNARASSHWVVHHRRISAHDEFASDLPLVKALPVTVFQPVSRLKKAWHATWANSWAFGIENVNQGYIDKFGEELVELRRKYWYPYTPAQLHTNAILVRYLMELYPTVGLDRVLGHEQVQSERTVMGGKQMKNKWDPGPLFPLLQLRNQVLEGMAARSEVAHRHVPLTPVWDDVDIMELVYPGNNSRALFWKELSQYVKSGKPRRAGNVAMQLLGYDVPTKSTTTYAATSVRIFQRMMGLLVDGIMGPITRRALRARLIERQILA